MAGMARKVYSTKNVTETREDSLDNETKLIMEVNYLIKKGTDLLTESTSGKMPKTDIRLWLTKVENIVKEAENKASGKDLIGKMKKLDELKVKLEESLVAEENAGQTSQGKLVAEENAGKANEGGKMAVVGMGGVGKVRLVNKEAVDMEFEAISVAEEYAEEKSSKKKNSLKAVAGMGGVGDTDIENNKEVKMKFTNIGI